MLRLIKICACAVGAITALTSITTAADPAPQKVADQLISTLQQTNNVPGMSAAVYKNGELIWSGNAGMMDLENAVPVNNNTRFRFASVSKLFTATLAAQAVTDGALDPDAPISKYLPSLPKNLRNLTVKQLVSHTSGLPHYQAVDRLKTHGKIHYSSVTEALAVIGNRALLSKPGTNYHYSSHGYTLLSAVLEAALGDTYLDLVERHLTRPTGIRSIKAEDVRTVNRARSEVYQLTPEGPKLPAFRQDNSHSLGGAGKEGTAIDLAKFGMSIIDGSVIQPKTLALMQKPVTTSDGQTVGRYYYRVGFGWRTGTDATGRKIMHHAGVTQGARSVLVVYPEDGISVAVLSNASWIASIERTASTIALPFIAENFQHAAPILQATIHDGTFGNKTISGSIEANCRHNRGSITETSALSSYLRSMNHVPADSKTWPLVCISDVAGISYYGLATPLGLVTLKADTTPTETEITGMIGKSGALKIRASTPHQ